MKRLFFFVVLFASFTSCKKDDHAGFPQFSDLTNELLNKSDFVSLQQAFQMLSLEEEERLWNAKFEAILKNDKDKLTEDQYSDVQFIYSFILQKGYKSIKDDPEVGAAFLDQNIKRFEDHFSKVQLYMLVQCAYYTDNYSILRAQEYADYLAFNTNKAMAVSSTCECRYNLGCPGWSNDCEKGKGNCTLIAECGLLGHSTCTGRCSLSF